ncbi:MAG: hypothetical protein A3J48_02555 [Candidatus Doudnabacteria bacterium RIFCSPHIGHO2_02_FULL_46_11]|uniref:DUF458 domain-containing protein n=1 Tax=Candidatus Doudnabacteria bacterium RIFCSPHIGHO2_02_FULL_46_11 TaxID=1817832 RepID=A0A1F5P9D9_9BACT|nr:MAG: hypothetical protein A3J48_02555 [Candidatus Doudnabacteria bacterium RIFCSPHIGHO2_02_FULL_46_11]
MKDTKSNLPQFESFYNDTLGKLSFEGVIDEVMNYVSHDSDATYKIYIGSDSLSYDTKANIVSTVVVYRVGNGGKYFWHRFQRNDIHNLRAKIHAEVECSIELAQKVLGALSGKIADLPENLEIHADVGQNGNTRDLIAEVTGWIKAYGIKAKTKPDSFAASSVADRRTISPSRT